MAEQSANSPTPEAQASENNQHQPGQEEDFDAAFAEYASGTSADHDTPEPQAGGNGNDSEEEPPEPSSDDEHPAPSERERQLMSQLERLQQSEASQRGRVGALQRQINAFRRQQAGQPPREAPQNGQPSAGSSTKSEPRKENQQERDTKQAAAEAVGSEDWESLKQDFPDIARALESRLDQDRQQRAHLEQQIAEMQSTVQPMQEQAHQQYLDGQMRALEARHTDWQEVVNAPAFQQWLNQQPDRVQAMMESEDAAEAAALLDFYKGSQQQAGSNDRAAAQQAERDRRQQRLAQSQAPQRRGTGQRHAAPEDFEAAFKHYASQPSRQS
ncbi:hypothetical protein [Kushneria aurantia]|uniref:Uncharacterized protein n=1 Tax=Kushneria aurantia TaxID=504092 RepID=A0ABV6G6G8_9GAMM|nr:hypothetical protein [Kushneria aurantia]